MNPLEYIDRYTDNIKDAAITLKQLSRTSKPLPSMEYLCALKDKLMKIQPKDVINQLIYSDYEAKRRFIIDSLTAYLEMDANIGAVLIDGNVYDYWDGMNEKLSDKAKDEVEAYTDMVVNISFILHDSIEGMRKSINYLFQEPIFKDRNIYEVTPEEDPQQENKLPIPKTRPSKKGRPKDVFSNYISDKAIEIWLLPTLHQLIDEKGGKNAVLPIAACISMGLITTPTYKAFVDEFGELTSRQNYNKYREPKRHNPADIDSVKQVLKHH